MSLELGLTRRRAFVTGGTRGVGAAVVEVLHEAGARVVATARSLPAQAVDGVHYITADLSTARGCADAAKSCLDRLCRRSESVAVGQEPTVVGDRKHSS